MFLFGIELQSSYIDRNRRIYAISTVTHTRPPGNNGGLLTTHCVLTRVRQPKTLRIWGMCVYAQRHYVYAKNCTLHCKNQCFGKKPCCSSENHTSPNIFIFKTCHLYLDTGTEQYIYLVGYKASYSSLSFSIICAVVMFQRVEKGFTDWCFSLTLFRKHFSTRTKRLHCQNDARIYNHINF